MPDETSSSTNPLGDMLQMPDTAELSQWADVMQRLQGMWLEFQQEQAGKASANPLAAFGDPARWVGMAEAWFRQMPLANPEVQHRLWQDGMALWEGVLGQYGIGSKAGTEDGKPPELPRKDRRFADPKWREQPYFAVLHQTYLMFAEQIQTMADNLKGELEAMEKKGKKS